MDERLQRKAAKRFTDRWITEEGNEEQQSRSFWIELLGDVLDIANPTYVLDFERKVHGRKIDVFYEDMGVLIEQKSRGVDLDKKSERSKRAGEETPYQQAKWYADNLPHSVRPRWIVLCNFDEFRIHDLDTDNPERDFITLSLNELPNQLHLLDFFTDHSESRLVKEQRVSIQASEIVGRLYKSLSSQYHNIETNPLEQRSLNVLIVRLVFLLYAEDAGILQEHQAFLKYMKGVSATNFRDALISLFTVLDTPVDKRDPYLNEDIAAFPYINGSLFSEQHIVIPQFTEQIRFDLLKEASQEFDWSGISPTIFGAAFESSLNPETRRTGGMHYTSIENIHKVIDPLFLNDLKSELASIEGEKVAKRRNLMLRQFQDKLASIRIFDPACGSGNFLTESYLSLRKLENRVLESLMGDQMGLGFSGETNPIKVSIDQFYGIEINDFAVAVAKTALWISEEQMMDATQEILLTPLYFLPLTSNDNIHEGNALRMDWNEVLPAEECSYLIGNPPFYGARMQSKEQKADLQEVFHGARNSGNVDYVGGWYMKAAEYMDDWPIRATFVSTNSICQGEQVANLWSPIFDLGFHIDYAYDTFRWRNEANDQAHVFVVIVGFSKAKRSRVLYHHVQPDCRPSILHPSNINAYLIDAPNVFIWNRSKPICAVPKIGIGNKPIDGGNYLFSKEEMESFLEQEPKAARYFHPWLGSQEFINGKPRYVLWLGSTSDDELRDLPLCRARIEAVRTFRLNSTSAPTRKLAQTPKRFHVENMPADSSVLIPKVSSERRDYLPMGFIDSATFCSDLVFLIPDASLYHFGILQSQFHNAWMRVVAGRLKSDYRYSGGIVYNNYLWPDPSDEQRRAVEEAAQAVLDIRSCYPDATLADLYDPDKMPQDLLSAHKVLDVAVEASYGMDFQGDEEKIVAHLFNLYSNASNH